MRNCNRVVLSAIAVFLASIVFCEQACAGTVSAGLTSPGLDFNGTNSFVTTPPLVIGNNQITVEAWIRPRTAPGEKEIVRARDQSIVFRFQNNGTNLTFGLATETMTYQQLNVPITFANFADGNWHHVAAVYDGSNQRLIVDGAQIGPDLAASGKALNPYGIDIGNIFETAIFDGQIDEVRIWNIARSAAELSADSSRILTGTEPGLIRYFRFDETSGNVVVDAVAGANGTASNTTRGYFGTPIVNNTVAVPDNNDVVVTLPGFDTSLATQNTLTATISSLNLQGGAQLFQYSGGARGTEITAGSTAVTDSQRRVIFARSTAVQSTFDYTVTSGATTSSAVTVTLEGRTAQTITFSGVSGKLPTDAPFQVSALSSSNLPVILQLVSGPATFNGNNPGTVTLNGTAGVLVLRATQAGDSTYAPATLDAFITIGATQTITFPPPTNAFSQLLATASSGLPVSYSIVSGTATIVNKTLNITGTDPVTVRASQPGNINFLPAPDVDVVVSPSERKGSAQIWYVDGNTYEEFAGDAFYGPATRCQTMDSAGNVYVTGSSQNGTYYDCLTVKHKPDGSIEWAKRYSPAAFQNGGVAVDVDASGNVYVGVNVRVSTGPNVDEVHTLKYDSSGNLVWAAISPAVSQYYYLDVAVREDGVYAMHKDKTNGLTLIKYSLGVDPVNLGKPTQLWVGQFQTDGGAFGYEIAFDGSGNPVTVGQGDVTGNGTDALIVKWDRNEDPAAPGKGKVLFSTTDHGSNSDYNIAAAANAAGDVFTAGLFGNTFKIFKLSNDNTKTVFATYTLPAIAFNALIYDLLVDANGNVVVTGAINKPGGIRCLTVKYNSDGILQWEKEERILLNMYGQALKADGAGNIYVCGYYSDLQNNYDVFALKYDSSGQLAWSYLLAGPGNNEELVYALSLDASANVYLTGYADNGANDYDFMTIKLTQPNATRATSNAAASLTTAGVGQTVSFSVAAVNDDGVPLTISWNFGDGTAVAAGANVTHAFGAAGIYTVTVSLIAGDKTTTQTLSITVNAPLVGTGNDSDGDGFSDAFETGAGSNPNSATDTPAGVTASPPGTLTVSKIGIKLNFAKAASDSLSLSGTVDVPAGFAVSGKTVAVDIGGAYKSFVLDAKGGAKTKTESFKVTVKATKGAVAAQTSKYMYKASKGSFAAALADENLTGAADVKKENRSVLVTLIFNGSILQKTQTVVYTAKTGKTGSAK